jgi:hypothetical protein
MCALVQMTGSGNDGTGDSPWRVFMGGGAASTGWVQAFFDSSLGGSWPLDGILASLKGVNTTAMYGAVEQQIDTSYPGDDPHFIVLNAVYGAMQIWLDGVLVGQALRDSSLGGTPDLFVGADPSTFWGSPAMRVSNVATWDRNLLPSEIKMLSEAVLDSTMVASAWQPQA